MNKKTERKDRQGDPELTTSKKLDQIKTCAKIKRQTGNIEKKDTIISGKIVLKPQFTKQRKNQRDNPIEKKKKLCHV